MAESESSEVSGHLLAFFIFIFIFFKISPIDECPGAGARVPFLRASLRHGCKLQLGPRCRLAARVRGSFLLTSLYVQHFSVEPTAVAAPSQINSPSTVMSGLLVTSDKCWFSCVPIKITADA